MSRALTEFSGYIFTLVMAFYIAGVFLALKKRDEDRGRALFAFLQVLCAVFYVLALAILLNLRKGTDSFGLTYGLGGAEFLTLMAFPILFRKLYRDTDELLLCLNTASSPCILKASDGSDAFTYMILPVRLRSND